MDVRQEEEPLELMRVRRPQRGGRGDSAPSRSRQSPVRRRGQDYPSNVSRRVPIEEEEEEEEDMETRQSSINYDYHPILQFFEGYQ